MFNSKVYNGLYMKILMFDHRRVFWVSMKFTQVSPLERETSWEVPMCSRALEQLGCDTPETFSVNLRWENMKKRQL